MTNISADSALINEMVLGSRQCASFLRRKAGISADSAQFNPARMLVAGTGKTMRVLFNFPHFRSANIDLTDGTSREDHCESHAKFGIVLS
jgi:hypothetical protein